jgi:hypothetical protein
MKMCRDANLANWKITNVECVLEKLAEHCPHLAGLSLSGWKVLTPDNMVYIAEEFKSLERLDLSSVNVRRKSKDEKQRYFFFVHYLNKFFSLLFCWSK